MCEYCAYNSKVRTESELHSGVKLQSETTSLYPVSRQTMVVSIMAPFSGVPLTSMKRISGNQGGQYFWIHPMGCLVVPT